MVGLLIRDLPVNEMNWIRGEGPLQSAICRQGVDIDSCRQVPVGIERFTPRVCARRRRTLRQQQSMALKFLLYFRPKVCALRITPISQIVPAIPHFAEMGLVCGGTICGSHCDTAARGRGGSL